MHQADRFCASSLHVVFMVADQAYPESARLEENKTGCGRFILRVGEVEKMGVVSNAVHHTGAPYLSL